jgi:hypothetical protein
MGIDIEMTPSDDFERNANLFAAMVGGDIDQDQILNILEQEELNEDQMNELYNYLMDEGSTINTIDEFKSAVEKIKLS